MSGMDSRNNAEKLLVIIPAYNESECIESAVAQLKKSCPDADFIVVDDGSSDQTADICRKLHYPLLSLPVNLGLSGAFQAGVRYATQMGYGYAVQYDADGQHLPEYIPDMLKKAKEGADVVIGSRYLALSKGEKSMRRFGGTLLRGAIKLTTGKNITDPTSGLRMYNAKLLSYFCRMPNFDPEPDMIAYLIHSGYTVEEVPVKMQERIAGQSYLKLGRAAQYMIRMLLSILLIQWFRKRKG